MFQTFRKVVQRWRRDEAALLAAAVSYYLALSLFPTLLILTAGLGAFFRWTDSGNNARTYLLKVISDQVAPALATAVEQSLAQIQDYSPLSGPAGMVMLLFAALAIFSQFERAFDRMWNTEPSKDLTPLASITRMFTFRLRAFAMLCSVALLLILVFVAGVFLAALKRYLGVVNSAWFWWGLELAIQLAINALAFGALYRFLPKVRVRWQDAARGGLLAAVIWEAGRQTIATFLIGQHYTSAYGVIGGFLAIMLWGYYAVAVTFFGAEFVQVLGENHVSEDDVQRPAVPPWRNRARSLRVPKVAAIILDMGAASLLIYLALFLGFRHFRTTDVELESTMQRVVRFSENPGRHRLAMHVFAPLIAVLPGPYEYTGNDAPSNSAAPR